VTCNAKSRSNQPTSDTASDVSAPPSEGPRQPLASESDRSATYKDEESERGQPPVGSDEPLASQKTLTQLRHQVKQLDTLFQLSTMLSAHRDLQQVLDTAAKSAAKVMNVKAASIRLLDDSGKELLIKAVYNLSQQYLDKGPILFGQSDLYRCTLEGQIMYVQDMATDPRVLYPQDAKREGLVSILSAPMIYQNRPIGVIRLYTARCRKFTESEVNLLRAIAQLLATAIENAQLDDVRREHRQIQRQLRMAADVQRRMLPATMPILNPFDISARYEPSFELGGDFYDFIRLDGRLGVAMGDVVGKGIAASLLMASTRAALRAYAQDIYDLDEIIARLNVTMTRETLDNEFVTLFYGILDPSSLRMTYCNAGHEPPLLLRRGQLTRLETGGMIVGVDVNQTYRKGLIDLEPDDLMLIYTDGLADAQNFGGQRFGRHRVEQAMRDMVGSPARDVVNHILWEMRRYVGLNLAIDDTTIVVIRVTPN